MIIWGLTIGTQSCKLLSYYSVSSGSVHYKNRPGPFSGVVQDFIYQSWA